MIFSSRFVKECLLLLFILSVCFSIAEKSYCTTMPFDEYAVFCSYFKMSGDKPSDQDVEALCFTFDRPTYTAFKPSEMFTEKSLWKEKNRINKIIKSITNDATFSWRVKVNLSNDNEKDKFFNMSVINEVMPQPTPYISSRISRKGQYRIKKAITSFLKTHSEKRNREDLEIIITLKPEKSEYGYQKRNIVNQNVVLPIRYVIFQPTKVRIVDEFGMNK